MAAVVDKDKCTACGSCVEACPVDAIKLDEKATIDKDNCIDCGTCVDECPEEAISLD
ncbi:MAG: ferredoxin [Thermoplasmatales archaeon SG8-52-3]|nr:MAG: ferredoxin [Thermoplasmatales archaeon SG8-52-3]